MAPLKILISAYACRPNKGSELGVGWNVAREVARYNEVWVITQDNNERRSAIEEELSSNPVPSLHFIYYKSPLWPERWRRSALGKHVRYYLWQFGAYLKARRLHQKIGFDLAHHVTYVKYWTPNLISLLPVPFVWGPVGGGESGPRSFWRGLGSREILYEALRELGRRLEELDPFTRLTARRSTLALTTTPETAQRVRAIGAGNVRALSQVGLSREDLGLLATSGEELDFPLFISIGRLLHWKGIHIGIRAFAEAELPDSQYWIIGDGPYRARLEALVRKLGVESRVSFLGKLPREETMDKMKQGWALIHPSLHDSGGWVCAEAMAASKPVICLDLGGPATQVTEKTGIKVPAQNERQAITGLAQAMRTLAENRGLKEIMGREGRERILQEYTWRRKGEELNALYEELVDNT